MTPAESLIAGWLLLTLLVVGLAALVLRGRRRRR